MLKGALPYGVPADGVTKAALLKNAFFVANPPRPAGRIADDIRPVVNGSIKICIYFRGAIE